MLAIIETKNATHIAINVPVDEASEMLPALARLFEDNATFYYSSYSEVDVVQPKITFHLGNTYEFTYSKVQVVVTTEGVPQAFTGEFAATSPEAFANFNKVIEEKNILISDANDSIKYLKARLAEIEKEAELLRKQVANNDTPA